MSTAAEDAIRARRRLTNKLIAGREARRLAPFFTADARVIAGDGGLILGAEAIVEAFAAQFADPAFEPYVRTPDAVKLDEAAVRAVETGSWIAGPTGGAGPRGDYMAVWRKVTGQWVIETELFVTLAQG